MTKVSISLPNTKKGFALLAALAVLLTAVAGPATAAHSPTVTLADTNSEWDEGSYDADTTVSNDQLDLYEWYDSSNLSTTSDEKVTGVTLDVSTMDDAGADFTVEVIDPADGTVIDTHTVTEGDISNGEINLSASGSLGQDAYVSITANDPSNQTLVLNSLAMDIDSDGGDLEVVAEDADGNSIENATVEVTDADGNVVASGETDSNGNFYADHLAAGDYDIEITHTDYEAQMDTVTIEDGAVTSATYNLAEDETTGSVSVDVFDDGEHVHDVEVRLVDADGNVAYDATGGDGSVNFESVVTGDYTVEVDHPDYDETLTQDITVEENQTSDVSLDFADSDGSGGGSGYVDGDVPAVVVVGGLVVFALLGFAAVRD